MKEIIIIVLFSLVCICIIGVIYCGYLWIRNENVYRFRNRILHEDLEKYKKMPDYNEMLWSFKPLKEKYWIKP